MRQSQATRCIAAAVAALTVGFMSGCASSQRAPAAEIDAADAVAAADPDALDMTEPKRGLSDAESLKTEQLSAKHLLPLGVWLMAGDLLVFSYVDATAGPSVKGEMKIDDQPGPASGHITARRQWGGDLKALSEAERIEAGLPEQPDWLSVYGPQPPKGSYWASWRVDPRFNRRLHSKEYPDDLMVVIFDDSPEPAEAVWVRLKLCGSNACHGTVLNKPHKLKNTAQGDVIAFPIDGRRDLIFAYTRNITRGSNAAAQARLQILNGMAADAKAAAGKAAADKKAATDTKVEPESMH